jgi:hypothetical protein
MSSTSALADRFIIKKWIANLQLDPAITAQCAGTLNQGCNGGLPSAAAEYFQDYGVRRVGGNCEPWGKVCSSSKDCTLPTCEYLNNQCEDDKLYRVKKGSIQNLTVQDNSNSINIPSTISNIKRELLNGPVVASFFVPCDFMAPSIGYKWKTTNGIFINGAYNNVLYNMSEKSQGLKRFEKAYNINSAKEWGNIIMESGNPAAHAVSIVGWGTGNAGSYGDVSYWIVRNSWGPNWNEGGYFRIAMNDSGLNANLGLDIPTYGLTIYSTGEKVPSVTGFFGGCISFDPDTSTGDVKGTVYPSPKGSGSHSKVNWVIILIIIACVLIVGGVGFYYFKKYKRKTRKQA